MLSANQKALLSEQLSRKISELDKSPAMAGVNTAGNVKRQIDGVRVSSKVIRRPRKY